MKKKIALLLAGVMALTTLPMVSFAATSNTVNNSIFISEDSDSVPVTHKQALAFIKEFNTGVVTGVEPADVTLDFAANSPSTKGYVDLVIGNGEWESRGDDYDVLVNYYISKAKTNTDNTAAAKYFVDVDAYMENYELVRAIDAIIARMGVPTSGTAVKTAGVDTAISSFKDVMATAHSNNDRATSVDTLFDLFATGGTYDLATAPDSATVYADLMGQRAKAVGNMETARKDKVWFTSRPIFKDTATVAIPQGYTGTLAIPVLYKINSKTSNVTVTISNRQANASGGTFTVAQVASGGTVTYIEGADSSKTQTEFDIITKETSSGKLAAGTHTVTYKLPSSFEFVSIGGIEIKETPATVDVLTDKMNLASDSEKATAKFNYSNDATVRSIDVVYSIPTRKTSNITELGAIKLSKVKVVPTFGSSKYGDILMDVTGRTSEVYVDGVSTKSDALISNQSDVKVGTYVNWGITLTAKDSADVPTSLVSGRLEGNITDGKDIVEKDSLVFSTSKTWDDSIGDMKLHETMEVTFQEVVPNSWWAGRETEFSVPEGVNIIKVEFTRVDNVQSANGGNEVLKNEVVNFATDLSPYVNIEDNVLTLQNLEVFDKKDVNHQDTTIKEKARIDMILWVASDVNFEGDIDLTVSGNAIVDEVAPLTIATTVAPYVLDTKVTTVPLDNFGTGGIQQLDVADIYVSETELGRFSDSEQIYVDIVDGLEINGISTKGIDIRTATVEVVEGDLEINKYTLDSKDGIRIDIKDSSSKSKPSTIKISNVTLTLDGTVPVTNVDPLQVVVTSDRRANNDISPSNNEQTIRFGAVHADYVNVQTHSGTIVTIKPGDSFATIDGEQVDLDVAAFIDPATDSLMVPLRFISVATGVDNDSIIWDPHYKTVTFRTTNLETAQFKVGSTYHTIDGTTIYNANGAVTQIVNERTFVPLRTLGNALRIPVSWDEVERIAQFN